MAKELKQFITEDGKIFNSLEEAEAHEARIKNKIEQENREFKDEVKKVFDVNLETCGVWKIVIQLHEKEIIKIDDHRKCSLNDFFKTFEMYPAERYVWKQKIKVFHYNGELNKILDKLLKEIEIFTITHLELIEIVEVN